MAFAVGVIIIGLPAVGADPPQAPLYQVQFAPGLRLPPFTLKVVDEPGHTADGEPDAELAAVEFIFTVTDTDVLLLMHCNTFHDTVT